MNLTVHSYTEPKTMAWKSYAIEGMHCQSCVSKIRTALEQVAGIARADVTLSPPQVRLQLERDLPFDALDGAVRSAGAYRLNPALDADAPEEFADSTTTQQGSLYPLVLILAYLSGTVVLLAWTSGHASLHALMAWFMGGFFLVFSFFKLLDVRGFADAYRSYDIVARAVPAWGYVYPLVELGLGVAYLTGWSLVMTNVATLVLMLIGSVGVFKTLLERRAIQCACLGTVLKLPMTKVTLIEDLGMAAMAALMLILLA